MPRKVYNAGAAAAVGPYSHAVEANGLVHLSGQTPLDPASGKLVEGDVGVQTAQCLNNLFAVLAEAGLDSDDVVSCSVYLTDMNDFRAMNAVYQDLFSQPYPARTTIGVAALPLGARVEIGLIAARRADRR
jgi:2-iminobutanoate/2-iminopropanoate deaminase